SGVTQFRLTRAGGAVFSDAVSGVTTLTTSGIISGGGLDLLTGGDITDLQHIYGFAASAAEPNYTFTGDINTGMFSSAANNIDFSTNGVSVVNINSTGDIDIEGKIQTDIASINGVYAYCHGNNGATADQNINDCDASATDIAEFYPGTQDMEPGDLVSLVPNDDARFKYQVVKSTTPYDQNLIGVVSTIPTGPNGDVLGDSTIPEEHNPQAIGLAGRVAVKVSLENGPIHTNDYLTSSSTPGIAMKATRNSRVIGRAIEDYDGSVQVSSGSRDQERYRIQTGITANKNPVDPPAGIGKILMFTNPTWYDPDVQLADSGNLTIAPTVDANFEIQRNGQG
ncbi:MAG: hypothetical protein AAB520_01845, partial [Patescibacteria group bacterium]